MFALFDKENIEFPSLKNPDIALKLLNGEEIDDIVIDYLDKLSEEVLDKLININNCFKLSDLGDEDVSLIEEYHDKYMQQNIYHKVTKSITTDTEIMKMAKSIGKSKKKTL